MRSKGSGPGRGKTGVRLRPARKEARPLRRLPTTNATELVEAIAAAAPPTRAFTMPADMRETSRLLKQEFFGRMFGVQAARAVAPLERVPLGAPVMAAYRAGIARKGLKKAEAAPAAPSTQSIPEGSNVLGVGYGAKSTLGHGVDETLALRVYVRTKLPRFALSASDVVPAEINGTPTDVIAVGDLAARSVNCGVSVGHILVTAGTLGCLVSRVGAPATDVFILSNNHVLANANVAKRGDPILQPGSLDGGRNPQNRIATLTEFVPLDLAGGSNTIDAALALLDDPTSVTAQIEKIGAILAPPSQAQLYMSVRKWGRTTNHTVGVVVGLSEDVKVRYGSNVAHFEDQLAIVGIGSAAFSDGGDSGSLIVDAVTRQAVGLLFADGAGTTFANPITVVLADQTLGIQRIL